MCLLWWVILMQEVGGDSIQVISNHYVCEKHSFGHNSTEMKYDVTSFLFN